MQIARTTTMKRLEQSHKHFSILQGGTGSGKTIACVCAAIGYAQRYPGTLGTITTDSYPSLRTGAMRDFRHILDAQGLTPYFTEMKTESTWTYINGSQIEFVALDNPLKARGGRRDFLYVNEANRIPWETFDQMAVRTRDRVLLDFNPSSRFWAHDELLAKHADDCELMISTYLDNEALSERERLNIESHDHSSNWWRVYGMGQIGELENNIYSGWQTATSLPDSAQLMVYGLDFGDHPDPTALIGIWRDGEDLYFKQLVYQSDTLVSTLGEMIEQIVQDNGDRPIICDYGGGGATLIRQLQSQNLQAIPADKTAPNGGSSVLLGISELQQARNVHLIGRDLEREYLSYAHRVTPGGVVLPTPKDGNDHLLDALRYAYHSWIRDDNERRASLARARMYAGDSGTDDEW